jgi:hypothetical protein
LVPVVLVLASLAGTWCLVVAVHRRQAALRKPPGVASGMPSPAPPIPAPPPMIVETPAPRTKAVEDPTVKALAALAQQAIEQRDAASAADRRADALEHARRQAVARASVFRRREMLLRSQIDALDKQTRKTDDLADSLDVERDVLAKEAENLRADLTRARSRTGAAVLPYKGANGTWRVPIAIECANGAVTVQPKGPTITLLELSPLVGLRSSPLVMSVARQMVHLQAAVTPDGAPAVPYILFVVRPDGIRPYYEARARLELLGLSFGYELVEQDEDIEYPDLTDSSEWSETPPSPRPPASNPEDAWPAPRSRSAGREEYVWRAEPNQPGLGGDPESVERHGASSDPHPLGGGFLPAPAGGREAAGLLPDGTYERPRGPARTMRGRENLIGGNTAPFSSGLQPEPVPYGIGDPSASGTPAEPAPFPLLVPRGDGPLSAGSGGAAPATISPRLDDRGAGAGRRMQSESSALDTRGLAGMPATGGASASGNTITPGRGIGGSPDLLSRPGSVAQQSDGSVPAVGDSPSNSSSSKPRGTSSPDATAGISGTARQSPKAQGIVLGRSDGSGTTPDAGLVGIGLPAGSASRSGSSGASNKGGSPGTAGIDSSVPYRKERKLEVVVTCDASGVKVQPGGYRINAASLDAKGAQLIQTLRAVAAAREATDRKSDWKPRLKFLVEPGGEAAYWKARKQTIFSGLGWPIELQIAERDPVRLSSYEERH